MRSATGIQFCEWWDRVRFSEPWFSRGLAQGFAYWYAPRDVALTEEEEEAILDELEVRGMVVTEIAMEVDDAA